MTTQVIFKIDKKLKDKAMDKAKKEGIAFSAILKLATKAFVDGDLSLGLVGSEEFNAVTRKEIQKAQKDISQEKNISRSFSSTKEAVKFLEA